MIYFLSDYSLGAHPKILKALEKYNYEHNEGYGLDNHSKRAEELIKDWIKNDNISIYLLTGGTLSNIITISSALKPYEAVVGLKSGHIYSHETGAIESIGHRIITFNSSTGKITPEMIDRAWEEYEDEHTVIPKLVYISQPTEIGTLYSKDEMFQLSKKCKEKNMFLYVDGARLGTALTAKDNDLSLEELTELSDAFYIGGTKNGALFGEALIIKSPEMNDHFRYIMKQHGGLFAKGSILGIQFETLLEGKEESIFFDMAKHANKMAEILFKELKKLNIKFFSNSQTNQIFPILPSSVVKELQNDFAFYIWAPEKNSEIPIRLVTSWGTKEEDVYSFVNKLKELLA